MTDGWPIVPLESVVRFQEGPGILAKDFHPKGVPLVRLAGLGGHQVTLRKCDYLDPSLVATKWSHFRLNKGDILISTSASFGRPAVVGAEAEGAVFYTGLIRFRSISAELDEGYLKTFLGSRVFMIQAEAQASGSVISHFGPSHLRRMEIPLPPLLEQQNIARVHSALDDKIDLNYRMNETLEAMARATFKDWFVDFGPTRAKMEGRAPYLSPEIWALFPDRLNDKGAPLSWEEVKLESLLELSYGKSLPASERQVGSVPVYGSGGINGFHSQSLIGAPAIIVGRKGTVGSLYWEHRPCFPIDTVFYVNSELPLTYCYHLLETLGLTEMNTDAAVPGLNRSNVYRLLIPSAPASLIEMFGSYADELRARVVANKEENITLAATRDFLLPKLMSGDVRVKDAETIAELAA